MAISELCLEGSVRCVVVIVKALLGLRSSLLLSASSVWLACIDILEMKDGPYKRHYNTLEKLHSSF